MGASSEVAREYGELRADKIRDLEDKNETTRICEKEGTDEDDD